MIEKAENIDNTVQIKAYNKRQIMELYGIGYKTFRSWIKPFELKIGRYRGRCYTPDQVKIIFEHLGHP